MSEAEIKQAHHILKVVKLMCTLNITLYSIDDFEGTPFYKHSLKNKINTAKNALELEAKDLIKTMFKADEATIQAKLKEYEDIATMLAKADFDDLTAINQGLTKYYEDKKAGL